MAWKRVCAIGDVAPGEAVAVDNDPPISVFNIDGEWLATSGTCTHDASPLVDGYVEGDVVECSWHFARFCLRTGAALSLPATRDIETYRTKVEQGVVYVAVSSDATTS
ncbi:non-heme iron oxygenase ferredoxin subunit [Amycolatopsis sp. ATCC 39116]|uniref:non-heme iron oxygenase ferredoxin subunit n=1 Tax=Amycolatopsis sp. (strain ATCC 39116 / 75iv2) TaxID=385957 RepID=UPI0002626517|nr:non-heme iron oxygenase ferredoxin subunit [Amycolatopsis sp. ATCC 39116]